MLFINKGYLNLWVTTVIRHLQIDNENRIQKGDRTGIRDPTRSVVNLKEKI